MNGTADPKVVWPDGCYKDKFPREVETRQSPQERENKRPTGERVSLY